MNMDVRAIQRELLRLGYDPKGVDGAYGAGTRAAVRAFQKARGLDADGVVGKLTFAALFPTVTPNVLKSIEPLWWVEANRRMGLHETRNKSVLSNWLKSDGETLGDPSKLPWCFTGETEILTEQGWQRFDRLDAAKVWQVDESGRASLAHYFPVTKDYDGTAYKIDSSTVQVTCDEGHRWWGVWGRHGRAQVEEPARFGTLAELNRDGLSILPPRSSSEGCGLSDNDLMLVAAFMSDGKIRRRQDGSPRYLEFEVSKQRKIDALLHLAPQHVYKQRKAYGELTVEPLTVFSFDVPGWFSTVFTTYKHLARDTLNSLSQKQCQAFIHHYSTFDGSVRDDGRITLYTSDEQIRDDLMTIALLAGYWPRLEKGGQSDLTRKPSWRIGVSPVEEARKRIRREDVSKVPFTGKMYCVTVPDGRIIVRGEGLTPCVTGNCGDFVATALALTLPDEPQPANPYWAQNWAKFGVELSKPALGAILVFVRPGGGHVGFCAGADFKYYAVLGGNQSNAVTIARIERSRCIAIRWPGSVALPGSYELATASGAISKNEA